MRAMSDRIMSDEFDGLDATEKAGILTPIAYREQVKKEVEAKQRADALRLHSRQALRSGRLARPGSGFFVSRLCAVGCHFEQSSQHDRGDHGSQFTSVC